MGGRYYLTGTPGRPRSWYANLVAHPEFVFHLKKSVTADLAAVAHPVTDPAERERVFGPLLDTLPDLTVGAHHARTDWIADSPLVEVEFV